MAPRRRVSPASITLEMDAGSDLEDCIAEACRISGVVGCGTQFYFNGVLVLANVDTNQTVLRKRVHEEMCSNSPIKIAAAWRQDGT